LEGNTLIQLQQGQVAGNNTGRYTETKQLKNKNKERTDNIRSNLHTGQS